MIGATFLAKRSCERLRQHIVRDETAMATLQAGDRDQHGGRITLTSATSKAPNVARVRQPLGIERLGDDGRSQPELRYSCGVDIAGTKLDKR